MCNCKPLDQEKEETLLWGSMVICIWIVFCKFFSTTRYFLGGKKSCCLYRDFNSFHDSGKRCNHWILCRVLWQNHITTGVWSTFFFFFSSWTLDISAAFSTCNLRTSVELAFIAYGYWILWCISKYLFDIWVTRRVFSLCIIYLFFSLNLKT